MWKIMHFFKTKLQVDVHCTATHAMGIPNISIYIYIIVGQFHKNRRITYYQYRKYSGHGKRSEIPRSDLLPLDAAAAQISDADKTFSDANKEVVVSNRYIRIRVSTETYIFCSIQQTMK